MRRSWIGVLLTCALVACGGKSNSSDTSGAKAGTPAALVSASAAKTQAAGSTKAAVTIEYASLPQVKGPISIHGAGEFNLKEKLGHLHLDLGPLLAQATASQQAQLPKNAGDVDIVFTGPIFYMKAPAFSSFEPTFKPWLRIDVDKLAAAGGGNLTQLQQLGGGSDPSQQLTFLKAARDVKVAGSEDVRGVATTHYTATVDLSRTSNLSADDKKLLQGLKSQIGTATIPVEVWLDKESRARRFKMNVSTKSGDTPVAFTTTVEYFDFGSKVEVQVPAASEVTDLAEVAKQRSATTTTAKKP